MKKVDRFIGEEEYSQVETEKSNCKVSIVEKRIEG
jgi:hypothetical protein